MVLIKSSFLTTAYGNAIKTSLNKYNFFSHYSHFEPNDTSFKFFRLTGLKLTSLLKLN